MSAQPVDKVDLNVKILLIGDSNVGKSWWGVPDWRQRLAF